MAEDDLGGLFDAAWYRARYPDLAHVGDPLSHYLQYGAAENRDPNPWFAAAWYLRRNPDVAAAGLNPLVHYLTRGGAELRNPHPRFDAAFYAAAHPDAAANPLLFHLRTGAALGYPTEPLRPVADHLPAPAAAFPCPDGIAADIIVPVYRGYADTQRCLRSVLADPDRPPGRIIVIDDRSPEPALSDWLAALAASGTITLIRNDRNLGFVASANAGLRAAGTHDAVLLNADTEVPPGWLKRLMAQAHAGARVGTVSPFSNNATICSFPDAEGGPLPKGWPLPAMDDACRAANARRSVPLPTTVGFCLYIRNECLRETGFLDERAFPRGYGEENDFCLRASARGWRHLLACNVFVWHRGAASFGPDAPERVQAAATLARLHPAYGALVARHVAADPAAPARAAAIAALLAASGLPSVLLIAHGLGGGVYLHIREERRRLAWQAHVLLLEPSDGGMRLLAPDLCATPLLDWAETRTDDLARYLRAAGVTQVQLHHALGHRADLRALIAALGTGFSFTAHDYFAICPRINLIAAGEAQYCGEPAPLACTACIARAPAHGARDITEWRLSWRWLLSASARVICPSADTLDRLRRYGLGANGVVVPHETDTPPVPAVPQRRAGPLRVVLLGVLAPQKGLAAVLSVAAEADPGAVRLHLIGSPEAPLPEQARDRITIGGAYDDADLPALIAEATPDVIWLPAAWPETWSYTLSAAIASGLPIAASGIGALRERLAGRPHTALLPPNAPARAWIDAFARVGGGAAVAPAIVPPARVAAVVRRRRAVLIPERLADGAPTPCAYIRLLLPFDHLAQSEPIDVMLADAAGALSCRADVIATHRHALPDREAAAALADHARRSGAALLYDLDDDLLEPPPGDHPDGAAIAQAAATVRRLAALADAVWVSTEALAERLARDGLAALVVENGLDERVWPVSAGPAAEGGPARLLYMGTNTHAGDLALVLPAFARLRARLGGGVTLDLAGVTAESALPGGVERLEIPPAARASYPAFAAWLGAQRRWIAGIAPLQDSPFNRCKSAIKVMDYAALGLPCVASAGPVYGTTSPGGLRPENGADAWFDALHRIVTDRPGRETMAAAARAAFRSAYTLAAQRADRLRALRALTPRN